MVLLSSQNIAAPVTESDIGTAAPRARALRVAAGLALIA